jgi:hypothetical protein
VPGPPVKPDLVITADRDGGDYSTVKLAAVAGDDPSTMKVAHTFLVSNCSPAGLTLGPRHQALIGCSAAFNNKTQSVIIDLPKCHSRYRVLVLLVLFM